MRNFLITAIMFVVIVTLGIFYKNSTSTSSPQQKPQTAIGQAQTAIKDLVQPDPFEDLTIPYLREREYSSSLAELSSISENADYSSYLTSYDSDGLKINGLLTQPKGDMPEGGWPAIVFIHGYVPPTQYRTQERYVDYVNYLARNGYVVFKIDLRGHGDSEGEPGGAYYSSDYVIDALNAYSALQNADFVNESKIGLWGHSMAGNIALRSVAVKKDIPAVVIWGGAGFTYDDLRAFRISDSSYQRPSQETPSQQRRNQLFERHGQFDANNDFWKKIVPINYLEGVSTKIQLDHAINDEVVSVEYSRNLVKVLQGTYIEPILNEYPSGGHNISGASFGTAMQNTVNFFDEVLKL